MYSSKLVNQVLLSFSPSYKKYREDLSALLLTPDNNLWLASDETSAIERLSYIERDKFAEHKQFRVGSFINLPAPEDEEIDIEGLAYTDNYLWFVGSHSYKRKKAKSNKTKTENIQRLSTVVSEANRYILGRIPLINGELLPSCQHPQESNCQLTAAKLQVTDRGNVLIEALEKDPHLGIFVKAAIPSKDNGLDIEGIVVNGNRIFLGLRGPVLRGWAVILELEIGDTAPGIMNLLSEEGKLYKKHFVYLHGLGIRDLYQDGNDLLILAGPTMDLDGPVHLYRFQNGMNLSEDSFNEPEVILDIPYGEGDDHAEGVTLFEQVTGIPSVLIIYDSPQEQRLVNESGILGDVFDLRGGNHESVSGGSFSLRQIFEKILKFSQVVLRN
ncbi:MAG: DUF3616 domain-containing protein [Cyanobacteria bacterium P01_A01_bin.84]